MTVKAYIRDDFLGGRLGIMWRIEHEGQPTMYSNGDMIAVPPADNTALEIEPLRLNDEFARALLTALLAYYEGGEDTRSLRRDYDAERKRVDKMLDALISADRRGYQPSERSDGA